MSEVPNLRERQRDRIVRLQIHAPKNWKASHAEAESDLRVALDALGRLYETSSVFVGNADIMASEERFWRAHAALGSSLASVAPLLGVKE